MERAYTDRPTAMDPSEAATRISEFSALLPTFEDEAHAGERGIARIAQTLGADAAAVVFDGRPRFVVGVGAGDAAGEELARIAPGEARTIDLAGIGSCPAVAVEVDVRPVTHLVLARGGPGFSPGEVALASGMGT